MSWSEGCWISHTFYHQPIVLLPINFHWPTTPLFVIKWSFSFDWIMKQHLCSCEWFPSFMLRLLLNMLRIILRWHYHLLKFVINSLDNVVAVRLCLCLYSMWHEGVAARNICSNHKQMPVEILKYWMKTFSFLDITKVLDQMGLVVTGAQILASDGFSLYIRFIFMLLLFLPTFFIALGQSSVLVLYKCLD